MENDTKQLVHALGHLGVMAAAHAQAATEIAHARRRLFEAYLNEGFTESQSLELCKSLSL